MSDIKKRIAALSVSAVLAASALFSGCAEKSGTEPAQESTSATTTTAAVTETETETETAAEEPAEPETSEEKPKHRPIDGYPWATSVESGNLPYEKPEMQDDLFTYYNYEFLSAHQDDDKYKSTFSEYSDYVRKAVVGIINDETKKGHALDQMRIFYDQASDIETLEKLGLSELQPYLDMVDEVGSIDELNELLVSDDFPFSPFFMAEIGVTDMQKNNIVEIFPKLLLFDPLLYGGEYYNNHDNKGTKDVYDTFLFYEIMGLIPDFQQIGVGSEETFNKVVELGTFETAYGKYVDYSGKYMKSGFGAYADSVTEALFSPEEVWKLCPDIPLEKILDKIGMSGSELYAVSTPDWLKAMNDVWTEENLDTLKLMAKAKLFDETRPFRDPTHTYKTLSIYDVKLPTNEEYAFDVLDNVYTFSFEIAKCYADYHLGDKAHERLTDLTQKLVDTYKRLLSETEWLDEASRKALTEKLDKLTLNVLYPAEGYLDYEELELTPTDEGGTLFGNYLKLKEYRYSKLREFVNKPAFKSSLWLEIAPTTENAVYSATDNSINIFPGFVTELLYRDDMNDEELLSGIGFVIGHEISHSLDFMGSQFDAYGRPAVLFTEDDQGDFLGKTSALADYYSNIEIYRGLNVDGQLVVGEAAADLSGLQAVLEIAKDTDGMDYDAFFDDFANLWAEVMPDEYVTMYAVDEHPLNHLRVNVNAQMLSPIYDELGVKEGDTMYLAPEDRIVIWGGKAS